MAHGGRDACRRQRGTVESGFLASPGLAPSSHGCRERGKGPGDPTSVSRACRGSRTRVSSSSALPPESRPTRLADPTRLAELCPSISVRLLTPSRRPPGCAGQRDVTGGGEAGGRTGCITVTATRRPQSRFHATRGLSPRGLTPSAQGAALPARPSRIVPFPEGPWLPFSGKLGKSQPLRYHRRVCNHGYSEEPSNGRLRGAWPSSLSRPARAGDSDRRGLGV